MRFLGREEKVEDAAKAIAKGRNMIIQQMESTQGQNLARHIIALSITFVWLLMFVARMALPIAGIWLESSEKWDASAQVIGDNIEQMTGAVMLILGFYFASPYLGQIINAVMGKFAKKKETS